MPLVTKIGAQNAWSTIQAAPKINAAAKVPVCPSGRARFHGRPSRSPAAKPANRYRVSRDHDAVTAVKPALLKPSRTWPLSLTYANAVT